MSLHRARNGVHSDKEFGGFRSSHCGNSWRQLKLGCATDWKTVWKSKLPRDVLLQLSWPNPSRTPQMQQCDWFRRRQRVHIRPVVTLTCRTLRIHALDQKSLMEHCTDCCVQNVVKLCRRNKQSYTAISALQPDLDGGSVDSSRG